MRRTGIGRLRAGRTTGRTLTVVVAVAVLLAGCSGFGPGVSDAGSGDGDGTGAGADGGDGAGGGNGGTESDAGDASDSSFHPFQFDRPATYTFAVTDAREGTGTLVWDVQEIDGENVTLRSVFEFGGETHESKTTVNREELLTSIAFSPGGRYAAQTMFSPMMSHAYGKDLRVGQSWSFRTQDGTMKYEVTDRRTYAGVECYYSEVRMNGSVAMAGCYSPDHGVAPYSAYFEENGDAALEVELTDYKSN